MRIECTDVIFKSDTQSLRRYRTRAAHQYGCDHGFSHISIPLDPASLSALVVEDMSSSIAQCW
jgi:hypothetical protein